MVLMLSPLLYRYGYGFGFRRALVLIHGGLRGAVSLALALVVVLDKKLPEEVRDYTLFYAAGVAFLTLVINASTAGSLVRYLGLTRATIAEREHLTLSVSLLNKGVAEAAERLASSDDTAALCNWEEIATITHIEAPPAAISPREGSAYAAMQLPTTAADPNVTTNTHAAEDRWQPAPPRTWWQRVRDPRLTHSHTALRLQQTRLRFLRGVLERYHEQVPLTARTAPLMISPAFTPLRL